MEDDCGHSAAGGQIHAGEGPQTRAEEDDPIMRDTVTGLEGLPCTVDVGVNVLLRGPSAAGSVAGVVVVEDDAARHCGETAIELTHLTKV